SARVRNRANCDPVSTGYASFAAAVVLIAEGMLRQMTRETVVSVPLPTMWSEEERAMPQRNPEDLPWNDVAADSDSLSADPEPDPAEVVGDEGEEEDAASHRVPDPYEKYSPETLDQRLAEEEPEATLQLDEDAEAGELEAPEAGGDDVDRGEEDPTDLGEGTDDISAEEAAVHVRRRP
ncbi:MAG: hypothetical protein ACREQ5_33725, partial [Candidatus Dormibacteria bacterium]